MIFLLDLCEHMDIVPQRKRNNANLQLAHLIE